MIRVRGVRGATTVTEDSVIAIREATRNLLLAMVEANGIEEDDIASIIFTTTPDLTAVYPASAVRELGYQFTPLMGMVEMDNPNGVKGCIRVLLHWNTVKTPQEINHIYQNGATVLRPDLKTES